MRTLLRKNLAAHKQKNFLTSIIYALTLGVIIFLLVSASLEIETITSKDKITSADLYLESTMNIGANYTDPVLFKYKSHQAAAVYVKIAMGMRVPNSELGHKMLSLEGENEIPYIPF